MDKKQEKELIILAQEGDSQSFEILVNRYYVTVYRFAFRWIADKEDAEDITQEVFIKLAKRLQTFTHQASFSTWLYRITVNCAKDYIRKKNRWPKDGTVDVPNGNLVSPNPGPEVKSFHEQVMAAVDKLPVKLKEAIILVFSEGMSHKETAQVLGCAETTVSWRIFQAKRKLQKVLS